MASLRAALAAALLLACCASRAAGHVVMIDPMSRPWLDYLENYNYNPHAVFAGGVGKVSKEGQLTWPAHNMNSICGDAAGEYKWDKPGSVRKTYGAGQTINVDVVFAQNHLGRMNVRVCPLDATDESKCTTLEQANGKGTDFDLPWTPGWAGVTDGFTAPLSPPEGAELYKMPMVTKAEGCATWACDQFKGQFVYRTQWKLPAGFTCDHCKLQMYYLTGSRCWPPCKKSGGCDKPVAYGYCGAPGESYPEEFWNCADIKITSGGSRKLLAA
jgi:hypothetical protein